MTLLVMGAGCKGKGEHFGQVYLYDGSYKNQQLVSSDFIHHSVEDWVPTAASGAGLPRFMGILGEGLKGVYSANEYLSRVNLMKAFVLKEYVYP